MSLRIRQIVLAARDLAKAVTQLQSVLGAQVCYRDPEVGKFGLENALLLIGDQFLEVVSPIQENTAAGRHLDRHGDSGYMLILQTDDLARDRARFERMNVRIVWQATHPDISAVHLHPKDIGAAIVSIDQPVPPPSWRWAGPNWQQYVARHGVRERAREILETTIAAQDATAMAKRWSQILDTKIASENAEQTRIDIEKGALNFVPAKTDVIAGFKISILDPQAALAAAIGQRLTVIGDTAMICGTRFQLSKAA